MKKTKCALGLVALATSIMALTGCSRVNASKDGAILTYTDANGIRTSYTAEDLLQNYQSYSSSLSTEFDKIYEVLVRHYYDKYEETHNDGGAKLNSLKTEATSKVLRDKQKAENNAANNKTSYEEEFQTYLTSAGVDNVDELYQKYLYDEEKKDFQDEIYNTYGTGDASVNGYEAMKNGYYVSGSNIVEAFPESQQADAWGRGSDGWIGTQMPYHIRHILIKLAGGGDKNYTHDRIGETTNDGGETTKLTSTLFRLAGATIDTASGQLTTDPAGRWTFGSVALSYSDDGSASNYGEYGIMEKHMAQDLVHEFKLGTYAFESLYSEREKASADAYKLMPGLTEEASSAADVDAHQKLLDGGETVNSYFANFDDDNDGVADGVGQIPFGAAIALYDMKKTVVDDSGNPVWKDNQDNFYPRNVIYNKYFNKHNVCVITPNVIGSNYKSPLLDSTSKASANSILGTYALSADSKSVVAEDFKGQYSAQLGALPGFSVDTTNVLGGADFAHNVLTNERGQVVLAVRAGSGASYQGIHFITVERSSLNKYGLVKDGDQFKNATAANLGTATTVGTRANGETVEKIAYSTSTATAPNAALSEYFTHYSPREADYPKYKDVEGKEQPMMTYVNFNKNETSDWTERVKTITGAITGFNDNLNTYYFQRLAENGAITFADSDLENAVKNYSATKRQSSVDNKFETWKNNWLEYAEMLQAQQAERFTGFGTIKGRLLTELAAISYGQANATTQSLDFTIGGGVNNLATLWQEGGACYYGK